MLSNSFSLTLFKVKGSRQFGACLTESLDVNTVFINTVSCLMRRAVILYALKRLWASPHSAAGAISAWGDDETPLHQMGASSQICWKSNYRTYSNRTSGRCLALFPLRKPGCILRFTALNYGILQIYLYHRPRIDFDVMTPGVFALDTLLPRAKAL